MYVGLVRRGGETPHCATAPGRQVDVGRECARDCPSRAAWSLYGSHLSKVSGAGSLIEPHHCPTPSSSPPRLHRYLCTQAGPVIFGARRWPGVSPRLGMVGGVLGLVSVVADSDGVVGWVGCSVWGSWLAWWSLGS